MSNFSFENISNTLKCLDEKVLIQLESILKFNCFLSMVYTKRPPKSYSGRYCGHRKNICENHCSGQIKEPPVCEEGKVLSRTVEPQRRRNRKIYSEMYYKVHRRM
jgi:hypothetical protein